MKPKLAIFLYSMGAGGAERVVSILIKELVKEYDVTLVLMCDIIFYDIPKEVNIEFIEKSIPPENGIIKLLKLPILAFRYKKLLKTNNIKLSISFMNRPNYINILANLFDNTTIIINERGSPSSYYPPSSFTAKITKYLISTLYPKADTIIVNSYGIKEDLTKNYNITKDIEVVYNPFDIDMIEQLSKESVELSNRFQFITVGRVDDNKNHKLLIDAFIKLDLKDTELVIIGDGENKEELQHYIESQNISNIYFIGKKNNPFKYLSSADLFVFGSKSEGFPNVLIEALSCSLPVISTDCFSGPREILDNNIDYSKPIKELKLAKYGILVPPNSINEMSKAMKILYSNKKLKEEYKNRAKLRAKDFDKDIILKEFKNIIKEYI